MLLYNTPLDLSFDLVGLLFWAMTLSGCSYALLVGNKEGKVASISYLITAGLSLLLHSRTPIESLDFNIFLLDTLYAIFLVIFVLKTKYYWPIWMCSFQISSLFVHIGKTFFSDIFYVTYEILQGFWSIPILFTMILGVNLNKKISDRQVNNGNNEKSATHI